MSSRKQVHIDTITRHFISFAKIMGIFPEICVRFMNETQIDYVRGMLGFSYFEKRSFYKLARERGRYFRLLNDNLVKHIYFFPVEWYNLGRIDEIQDIDQYVSLFMSYLRDKGIIGYIRIFGTE